MSQEHDLNKLERRAYLFYHQDGLLDIAIGLIAISGGLLIAIDKVVFWFIFYLLGISAWRAAKKWITYPRIGHVKFSEKRKGRMARFGVIISVVLALLLVGLILVNLNKSTGFEAFLRDNLLIIVGSFIALLMGVLAFWLGLYRFYLYAAAAFVVFFINQYQNTSLEITLVFVGGFITLVGLGLLFRFVRKYPKAKNEDYDGAHNG